MPSNPTTKSQVHAYKFVLRRMQSALVRKDAVMLHDPMRTHSRATMVGVVLSALGVLGFIIFSLFKPAPTPPDSGAIVIGEPSGQVYITTGEPTQLIPTFNLASARLLLEAQQNKDKPASGAASGAGSGGGSVSAAEAEVIPDDQLVDIPRGQPTGIPFGPPLLPTEKQRISSHWAVCEHVELDQDLPDAEARKRASAESTVVAGVSNLGTELGDDEALLVESPKGVDYLVYRLEENPNRPNADVVRAKVDLSDNAVRTAYGLSEEPRKISSEMLNAIPEAKQDIAPPEFDNAGQRKWSLDLGIGAVFSVAETSGAQYYVLTDGGKQKVPKAVANLIRYEQTQAGADSIPSRRPDQVVDVPTVQPGQDSYREVGEFPETRPTVLDPSSVPSACLGWRLTGEGQDKAGHTTLYVSHSSPVPKSKKGESEAVEVTQASPDGAKVDSFYMPPGRAAVVRSVTSSAQFGKGPIQLVSTRGVRYGVPNVHTAKILGLTPQKPAPELILRLLPTGSSLNVQNATREWPSTVLDSQSGDAARAGADQ